MAVKASPISAALSQKYLRRNAMSRAKDRWLEETGGFRFGESPEQFKQRVSEIARLRKKIEAGNAESSDVEKLAKLIGSDETAEEE